MTEPQLPAAITPPPPISAPTKAYVGAILGLISTVALLAAPFLPDSLQAAAYAIGAGVGLLGVPFGVYITPNPVVHASLPSARR